jgi:hypothetical protein
MADIPNRAKNNCFMFSCQERVAWNRKETWAIKQAQIRELFSKSEYATEFLS